MNNEKKYHSSLGKDVLFSLGLAIFAAFLTFPILGIDVDVNKLEATWQWRTILNVFWLSFILIITVRLNLIPKLLRQRRKLPHVVQNPIQALDRKNPYLSFGFSLGIIAIVFILFSDFAYNSIFSTIVVIALLWGGEHFQVKSPKRMHILQLFLLLIAFTIPWFANLHKVTIFTSALIYIILALGLHIVVGLGGMLNLGYVAFYAIGAYSYGLLFKFLGPVFTAHGFDLGFIFWLALPVACLMAIFISFLISLPVLRLRGDYLAIVTLAFAEITRILLLNGGDVTGGPSGIAFLPKPWFFGIESNLRNSSISLYYIVLLICVITYFLIRRLEKSSIGREWEAIREDQIAAQVMGININRAKLRAFCLGAAFAGFAGVLQASRTSIITPASFSLWTSVLILAAVVLGGIGSRTGAIIGALFIVLLPEDLRFSVQYQQLIFGISLVLTVLIRPAGLIKPRRTHYYDGEGDMLEEAHLKNLESGDTV